MVTTGTMWGGDWTVRLRSGSRGGAGGQVSGDNGPQSSGTSVTSGRSKALLRLDPQPQPHLHSPALPEKSRD